MKKIYFAALAGLFTLATHAQTRSTFDNVPLTANSYWNGSSRLGGFASGNAYFYNFYDTTYQSWSDFAVSNTTNVDTPGYTNQYSSITGGGVYGSTNYAVAYTGSGRAALKLSGAASGKPVFGFHVSNSTYAYLSMKNGDAYAKKFGGVTGRDPDYFLLTVRGYSGGTVKADSVTFYLADFRDADSTKDYIVKTWKWVDLKSLGNVDSLYMTLTSSDTGQFGMNTPAYFTMDDLVTSDGSAYKLATANDTASLKYTDTLAIDILANDSLTIGLNRTISLSNPLIVGATASLDSRGALVYRPAVGIKSTDTISYTVCDETGACSSAKVFIKVRGLTNTAINYLASKTVLLYPNPTNNSITIESVGDIKNLELLDMTGRLVSQHIIDSPKAKIDMSTLPAGIYNCHISTGNDVIVIRVVKN